MQENGNGYHQKEIRMDTMPQTTLVCGMVNHQTVLHVPMIAQCCFLQVDTLTPNYALLNIIFCVKSSIFKRVSDYKAKKYNEI